MRIPLGRPAFALLLSVATPLPLAAQAVGIGFGFGLGTRTGITVSVGLQVTREVQLVCKAGGFPGFASSSSCGTHLYLFGDSDRFVVAEVGRYWPAQTVLSPRTERHWLFVQAGYGTRDHELPDDDGDGVPEYPRWANVSWSGGLTLLFARVEDDVAPADSGEMRRARHVRPALRPLFFADAQAELYVPGRDCEKC